MKKEKVESEKISKARELFLRNLECENVDPNVYITFKYIINRQKLKKFQEREK